MALATDILRYLVAPPVFIASGGVMPNEAADVLAALYPSLLRFADKQLRSRHLDTQLAEDLVQEAAASWFAAGARLRTVAQMNTYLRRSIENRCLNQVQRRSDVLDREPLSLDSPLGEGHKHWKAEGWSAYFDNPRLKER